MVDLQRQILFPRQDSVGCCVSGSEIEERSRDIIEVYRASTIHWCVPQTLMC